MSNDKAVSVISDTAGYFDQKAKELDELLDQVQVPDQVKNGAMAGAVIDSAKEAAIEAIPFVGSAINKVLGWNDKVNEEIKQAKRDQLLIGYIQRSDDQAAALDKIKRLITSPQGNVLFNKLLWILDDNPPDPELIRHLSSALKHISDSDFARLFESHRFALDLIGRTSTAALAILSDSQRWPMFSMAMRTAAGSRVTNDWSPEFSRVYAAAIGLAHAQNRVQASVGELHRSGLLEAHADGPGIRLRHSDLGSLLVKYLDT